MLTRASSTSYFITFSVFTLKMTIAVNENKEITVITRSWFTLSYLAAYRMQTQWETGLYT